MRYCLMFVLAAYALSSRSQTSHVGHDPGAVPSVSVSGVPLSLPARSTTAGNENWTELSLDKSGLPRSNFNAVLLGRYEEPTYIRELVRVEWRQGDPIELTVVLPRGVIKPPVILYLYDYTADTTRFQNDGWCRRATQGGFAAVGFVSALSGQRFHAPRPMREWFVSELQESLATSTHDVQMVLDYVALRSDVDVSRTGMIAQGSGAAVAVLAAAVDPRIVALDLLNPWGDWPDWLKDSAQIPSQERAAYLTPAFMGRVAVLDPVVYLPKLRATAVRIQQLMDDPVTPAAARDRIASSVALPADQVIRYPDATAHQKAWRDNGLSGWIRTQLRPSVVKQVEKQGAASR